MKVILRYMISLSFIGCFFAFEASAMLSEQTQQAAISLGATGLGEIEFGAGSDSISDQGRAEIRNVVDEARKKGELDHIKVLAWSDQEYPVAKTSQSKASIDIAQRRIKTIEAFFKSDLKIKKVIGFNMAERPGKFKELFNTQDAKVKKTTEIAGAAPVQQSDTGLFGENGQASKAVFMIFTKK